MHALASDLSTLQPNVSQLSSLSTLIVATWRGSTVKQKPIAVEIMEVGAESV